MDKLRNSKARLERMRQLEGDKSLSPEQLKTVQRMKRLQEIALSARESSLGTVKST